MTFRLFILQLTSFISALKHSPSRKGRKDISFKKTVQSHQRTVSITNETDQQATLSSTSAPAAAVADAEEETALASADKLETTTVTATSTEDPSTNDGKNTIYYNSDGCDAVVYSYLWGTLFHFIALSFSMFMYYF